MSTHGFSIVDNKVVAESDKDVEQILNKFPIGTIITTHHNNSQIRSNKYDQSYYIIKESNGEKKLQGAEALLDSDIVTSTNAIIGLNHRRNSSAHSRGSIKKRYRSRDRSRDRSKDRSKDRSRRDRGGKKTLKKRQKKPKN